MLLQTEGKHILFTALLFHASYVHERELFDGLSNNRSYPTPPSMLLTRQINTNAPSLRRQRVDLGTLETLLVEGSASDEDRAEAGLDGRGVTGVGIGGTGGGNDAWRENPSYDIARGVGSSGPGLRTVMAAGHHGALAGQRHLVGRSADPESADDDDDDGDDDDDDDDNNNGGDDDDDGDGDDDAEEEDDDDEDETEDASDSV